MIKSKCHQLLVNPPAWRIMSGELFYQIVERIRLKVQQDMAAGVEVDEPCSFGRRFKDNARVYSVVRSNFTEDQFTEAPITCIYDALLFSAQMDCFYGFEKQYASEQEQQVVADRAHHWADLGGEA